MGVQKSGGSRYTGKRIFIDMNAYEILSTVKKHIKEKKVGTKKRPSLADAIRYLKDNGSQGIKFKK